MSAVPAPGALPAVAPLLAMRGSADAAACEGDACLVPGSASAVGDAEGSASADLARLRDAIDSGRAI